MQHAYEFAIRIDVSILFFFIHKHCLNTFALSEAGSERPVRAQLVFKSGIFLFFSIDTYYRKQSTFTVLIQISYRPVI